VQYEAATMSVLFCMGIVFGCARHFSGSTMLAVLLHAVSNGLGTISTMLELQGKVAAP
jgi:membrane protease YdiL (CAAX protease family)